MLHQHALVSRLPASKELHKTVNIRARRLCVTQSSSIGPGRFRRTTVSVTSKTQPRPRKWRILGLFIIDYHRMTFPTSIYGFSSTGKFISDRRIVDPVFLDSTRLGPPGTEHFSSRAQKHQGQAKEEGQSATESRTQSPGATQDRVTFDESRAPIASLYNCSPDASVRHGHATGKCDNLRTHIERATRRTHQLTLATATARGNQALAKTRRHGRTRYSMACHGTSRRPHQGAWSVPSRRLSSGLGVTEGNRATPKPQGTLVPRLRRLERGVFIEPQQSAMIYLENGGTVLGWIHTKQANEAGRNNTQVESATL